MILANISSLFAGIDELLLHVADEVYMFIYIQSNATSFSVKKIIHHVAKTSNQDVPESSFCKSSANTCIQ